MTDHPQFETDEILHLDLGKWGDAGYAIPNPAGKTWTTSTPVFQLHKLIGHNMFELMHRDSAKFSRAPHYQYWFDLHKMIVTARKRLVDRMRLDNDPNGLDSTHANPAPRLFVVYPVPYFKERVRQEDVRELCEIGLLCLSEIMQHSEAEGTTYITDRFASMVGKHLQEMLVLVATKYFGKNRADAYKPDFVLTDADFKAYNPAAFMAPTELTEERPPLQWWPTENDLSEIRAMPINEALVFAKRWTATEWLNRANGNVTSLPVDGSGGGVSGNTLANVAFPTPPGQAPG